MEQNTYTGRKIAILTDAHGLLEPIEAILKDCYSKGITEIYSLGDNIGVGPNPSEVLTILEQYGVISIAGNSEDYITLGIEPFAYFNSLKKQSHLWTLSKLSESQIGSIELFPHSIELLLGGKKLALCHFVNDVRFDYVKYSTWSYQSLYGNPNSTKQFEFTNSEEQFAWMESIVNRYGINHPFVKGILSAQREPLFSKKKAEFFDAVIQGHVHWKIYDKNEKTNFYSIRAAGMAYANDQLGYSHPVDSASYVILHEKENGFDIEEVLVRYDREKMIYSVLNSDSPDKFTISKFTDISINGR